MNSSNSNVIVYVKQPVPREQGRVLSVSVAALHGVIRAQASRRAGNMIRVDYDPQVVSSQHILQHVSACGFDARLVGM